MLFSIALTKLNGQISKYDFKIGQKDGYDLMCSVDAYDKYHVPMNSATSSDG